MINALKLGGIYAVVSIVLSIIYPMIMGLEQMFDWKFMLASFVIGLIIMIVLGRKMLRPSEGDDTLYYGEALKYLFVATLLGTAVSSVVSIARYNGDEKVEEAFVQYTMDAQEAGVRMGAKLAGKSEEEIEADLDEMREAVESGEIPTPDNPFTWAALPMTLLSTIFSSLVFSLIAAIFVKKT